MKNEFKLAACQMNVVDNKNQNIAVAVDMIKTAVGNNADMVVLPEMFNCPYNNNKFREYSECAQNGRTIEAISNIAKEKGVYVVAGSIPEFYEQKLFNTCFVFNRNGEIIGRHRKIHLFDIDIKGKMVFKESEVLSAGDDITVVDTELCKVGIAICYDIRFPELMRLMVLKGAEIIIIPAAFNMQTGPAHWELLIRTRAVDNQVYMAAVSPARNEHSSYVAYGNSMIVEPWGTVLKRADEKQDIIYENINLMRIHEIRSQLPLLKHRRVDIYDLMEK